MEERYTAFISYRHHKLDSAVAKDVQRQLEHFHIPKSIQKETGRKEIGRVFRDEEELPITADLNETILQALDGAAYLIVICSTHTAESQWVRREIEYFLKHHDRKHVLTVLADGDPREVIPDLITTEERTVREPDGTERAERAEYEPLFCDYRKKRRGARKEEIPRLAAAILDVSYDSLIQRARLYRTRRIAVAAAAVAAAGIAAVGYLSWSRTQIAESLKEARVSQAKYLSGEVESLLEEDRDVTAARLAVHAVPEDRSLTPPESWKALADASGAYFPETSLLYNTEAAVRVVGELHSADDIRFIGENHAHTRICTVDTTNHIHVWDAKKRTDLLSFQSAEEVRDIVLAQDVLAVGTEEELRGYSLVDGSRSWTVKRGAAGHYSLQTNADETEIAALNRELNSSGSSENFISVINAADGTILQDISLRDQEGNEISASYLQMSEDGSTAACGGRTDDMDIEEQNIWFCDLESGKLRRSDLCLYGEYNMKFLKNGSLVVRGFPDRNSYEQGAMIDSVIGRSYFGVHYFHEVKAHVYCLSPENGKTRWTGDIGYASYSPAMFADSFSLGDDGEAVYVTAADVLQIYDADTGEMLQRNQIPADIAFAGLYGSAEESSGFVIVCSDGTRADVSVGENDNYYDSYYYKLFQTDIERAFYYRMSDEEYGWFVQPSGSSTVLQYILEYSDPDFERFEGSELSTNILFFGVTDNSYAVLRESDDNSAGSLESPVLEIYDRGSRSLQKTFKMEIDPSISGSQVLGISADQKELLYYNCGNSTENLSAGVFAISLEDGTSRALPIPTEDPEHSAQSFDTNFSRIVLLGDRIYYVSAGGRFCTYDLHAEKSSSFRILKTNSDSSDGQLLNCENAVCALSVSPDASYAYAALNDGTSVLLNLKTETVKASCEGETALFTGEISASASVDWDEQNELLAVAGEKSVCVFRYDGSLLMEIPFSSTQATGVHFYQDMLLVAYTNGKLNRYRLTDGALLGSTEAAVYSATSQVTDGSKWIFREDGTLCLFLDEYATVVDTDEWVEMYTIPNCLAADTDHRRFIVQGGDVSSEHHVGCFPEYTLDELIEKCREAGGREDLDEETLARYGLEQ